MLSQLDNIIFPDRCDVLEVAAQRYVYPIFKNGSSSLAKQGYRSLSANELPDGAVVDVFVRDPYERFLSGVHTYLRYNTQLEHKTALHFITEYLFLNRHYCPQYHWLVNLQRHANVSMRLLPLDAISELTDHHVNYHSKDPELAMHFDNNLKVQFYLQLDKVLTQNLLHKTVNMDSINSTLQLSYPQVYKEVVQRSRDICTVLG